MADTPVIQPPELATYLNDPSIDTNRASDMIADAQTLCESVIYPLPDIARVVVKRMAARAYQSITSPRQSQLNAAGSLVGSPGGTGAVRLTDEDRADLLATPVDASGVAAFTIRVHTEHRRIYDADCGNVTGWRWM